MLGAPPVERRVALPEWPTPQEMKFWEVFTGLTSLRAHIWLHYYELVSMTIHPSLRPAAFMIFIDRDLK